MGARFVFLVSGAVTVLSGCGRSDAPVSAEPAHERLSATAEKGANERGGAPAAKAPGARREGERPSASAAPSASAGEPRAGGAREATNGFTVVGAKPSEGELRTVLKRHIDKAKAAHQKPYVELSATWCPPCQAIRQSLHDPRMEAAFRDSYIVQLDLDEWGAKLDQSGFPSNAIPVFYELRDDATASGRSIDGGAWGDNIPENMAPPLAAFFHPKS